MIELLSNFYLVREEESSRLSSMMKNIEDVVKITFENAPSVLHHSIKKYKNLKPVILMYDNSDVAKYFLSMFIKEYVKTERLGEMEDILMMNGCAVL